MLDVHCHILYGVDDGARDFDESVRMLHAAHEAGIDAIIATPHLRHKPLDDAKVCEAFANVSAEAKKLGIRMYQGYEAHYGMIADLDIEHIKARCLGGTNTLLLEFSFDILPPRWETFVVKLQRGGINVIVAHPERYDQLRRSPDIIVRMTEINCAMQLDADRLYKGIFSGERKCALDMLKRGQAHYIASDAHSPADYKAFAQAMEKFGKQLEYCEYLESL